MDWTDQGYFYDSEELVDLLTAVHSAIRLFFKNESLPVEKIEFSMVLLPPERGILWRGWAPEDQNAPQVASRFATWLRF